MIDSYKDYRLIIEVDGDAHEYYSEESDDLTELYRIWNELEQGNRDVLDWLKNDECEPYYLRWSYALPSGWVIYLDECRLRRCAIYALIEDTARRELREKGLTELTQLSQDLGMYEAGG